MHAEVMAQSEPMQLEDLLKARGLDLASHSVTLMRHTDGEFPVRRHVGTHALTLYQARQDIEHPVGSLMVGFWGHRVDHGLLLGVWRVRQVMPWQEAQAQGLLQEAADRRTERAGLLYHDLEELPNLADLRLKLELKWSPPAVSWRRVLKAGQDYLVCCRQDPPVPFVSLQCVSLVMAELRLALQDPCWQQALAGTCGIYLITDEKDGLQYVGSASGGEGVLQRWRDYAVTGHGGNVEMQRLLQADPGRENSFRFTLVEALPLGVSRREAEARENHWKLALGSVRFGMNRNGRSA